MRWIQRAMLGSVLACVPLLAQAGSVVDAAAAEQRGDYGTALRLYRALATDGHAVAQFNLGLMYADGRWVPKDDAQAVHWYRRAAEQGDANAQHNLGLMYAQGHGVPKDDAQAVHWWRRAAEQGDAFAQFNLGAMYAQGRGVPRNEQLAYFWWLLAAARGDAEAAQERDRIELRLSASQRAAAQAQARQWRPVQPTTPP